MHGLAIKTGHALGLSQTSSGSEQLALRFVSKGTELKSMPFLLSLGSGASQLVYRGKCLVPWDNT
jgi:hypothetical protein